MGKLRWSWRGGRRFVFGCTWQLPLLAANIRQKRKGLGTRGVLEYNPGAVGRFHYRLVLGLVALASSEQTVLEVKV